MANVDNSNYAQSSSLNQEAITDIKTNFYTREGLWALVPGLDYTKTQNYLINSTTNTNTQYSNNNNNNNTNQSVSNTNGTTTVSSSGGGGGGAGGYMTNNLSNEIVKLQFITVNNLKCEKCNQRITITLHQSDNNNVKNEYLCKYCNHNNHINNSNSIKTTDNNNLMEIIVFNFSRELYCYYYNGIKQPSDLKNLLDRKTYKSISVTCHDVNIESYNKNSNSLPIVVGFNKGEIHVYDAFKKDLSQCFNSGKTIDKTKATCVKWLPNSLNLFLISYASGNMYLYDVNYNQQHQQQQTSSNSMPNYQLVHEGDGYCVYTNVSIVKNSKNNSSDKLISNANGNGMIDNDNNSNGGSSSFNSSNPIMKWTITGYNNSSSSSAAASIPGINEFLFSPCGQYLALACQDGFLRVFNYRDMTLKSLMKSYFGGLLCLSWSSDGKYIATGGEDDLVTIFSFYENRVACRGRGHSSWINSVEFDNWAQSYNDKNLFNNKNNNSNNMKLNHHDNNNDHDQDSDFEDYHNNKNKAVNKQQQVNNNRRSSAVGSGGGGNAKRMSSISDYEQLFNTNKSIFYRLGSVGQDNKIAFWDLTDDVLKEKLHSRSRVASIAHTNSINRDNDLRSSILIDKQQYNTNDDVNILLQQSTTNSSSASSTIGSNSNTNTNNTNNNSTAANSGGALSFFKKHKSLKIVNSNKNNTLGKATTTATTTTTSTATTTTTNTLNGKTTVATKSLEQKFSKLNINQLCPKLDEIPIIEPLICKRISQERLTSLVFREDCFLVACQDGTISTWARPGKSVNVNQASESNDKIQVSTFL